MTEQSSSVHSIDVFAGSSIDSWILQLQRLPEHPLKLPEYILRKIFQFACAPPAPPVPEVVYPEEDDLAGASTADTWMEWLSKPGNSIVHLYLRRSPSNIEPDTRESEAQDPEPNLPRELWLRIFGYACDNPFPSVNSSVGEVASQCIITPRGHTAYTLTFVCRLWRELAENEPRLWTHITLSVDNSTSGTPSRVLKIMAELTRLYLRRSRPDSEMRVAPPLSIVMQTPHIGPCELNWNCFIPASCVQTFARDDDVYHKRISQLFVRSEGSLLWSLQMNYDGILPQFNVETEQGQDPPTEDEWFCELRSLVIDCGYNHPRRLFPFRRLPNLESLTIKVVDLAFPPGVNINFPSLQRMSVASNAPSVLNDVYRIAQRSNCHAVELLLGDCSSEHSVVLRNTEDSRSAFHILIPKLRSVEFSLNRVFNSNPLVLTGINTLEVIYSPDAPKSINPDFPLGSFVNWMTHSCPTLQTVCLRGVRCNVGYLRYGDAVILQDVHLFHVYRADLSSQGLLAIPLELREALSVAPDSPHGHERAEVQLDFY
ncbi:hypothetical protein HHX47_DHR6000258 [Lentinula edodes]|nr:hypothetical protein HHX47_DHR6000258 [Lentinula edodes]